ncbi:hypothetical protein H4S14_003615 [Agrobacterium vitis]|nr:hypothetical protein [Agrobacterium vitis]MBE1439847.1 hypothetical protein [Agrobacterium vitis]
MRISLAKKITGILLSSLAVAALLGLPFAWMVRQTWKDD